MLHNLITEKTAEELEQLGKTSTAIKESGSHLATIKSVFNTTGEKNGNTWSSITVQFENDSGETVSINEFYGKAKDGSQEAIDKANRSNTRLMGIMTRLAKSAGFPEKNTLAAATAGHVEGKDEKGRDTVTYPKFANKKVYIVTTTEISADHKDPNKTYVKQIVDTSKFLDKDGKDAMGRDCIEAYNEAAKSTIEIAYGDEANIACIQALAKEQEKALGTAPAQQLSGMPAGTTQAPATANDDI